MSSTFNDILARLVTPTEENIFNRIRFNQDSNAFVLPENGSYSLVVNGGNSGGDYSFQLLELGSSANNIDLDTQVTGSIDNALETQILQFEATSGQNIYFDSTDNNFLSANVSVYGGGNKILGNNSSLRDFIFDIPSDGIYNLIIQSNTEEVINYDFTLVTPELQQASIEIGETTTGNLAEAGEKDLYLIEGTAGQRIWFDGLASDSFFDIDADLFSIDGKQILNNTRLNQDSSPIILPTSGTYSLVVSGGDVTGNYSFRLLDLDDDAININTQVENQTEIDITLETGLETKLYQFEGTAGQQLVFESISASSFFTDDWQINGVDNVQLNRTPINNDFVVTLPANGIYTLLVDGSNSNLTDFTFKVFEQTIEEQNIALNTTISSSLANNGEQDIYRFTGNAGQRIWFDGLIASDTSNINVDLSTPTGQSLISNQDVDDDSNMLILPESGTYTITVTGDNVTGDYSFRVLNLSDAESIDLDEDINATNDLARSTQLYSFDGSIGQQLLIDMVDVDSIFNGSWRLYGASSDEAIASDNRLEDFNVTLPVDDTYTLVVLGSTNDSFEYTFNINDVTISSNINPSGFNTIQTGTLATVEEEDIFTFDAVAGTRFVFDGLTSDSSSIRARLTSPDSTQLFSSVRLTNNSSELTLPESGTYSLTVSGAVGDYSFRILDLNEATTIPLDEVFNGSMTQGSGIEVYEFQGTAGQQLYFNGISSTGSGDWRLYSPDNREIDTSRLTSNFEATLPSNGTYKVLIDGQDSNPFDFSVEIVNTEIQSSTISIDEIVTDSLTKLGSKHIYSLDGTAGQRVLFDGLGSTIFSFGSATAVLNSPSGEQIMSSTRTYQDSDSFILPESGEYSLVVSVTNEADDYSFRLLNLDNPTITNIALDTVIEDSIATDFGTQLYQFTGTAGQELFFNGLDNSEPVTWRVIGATNGELADQSSFRDFKITLPYDGIYTLAIDSDNNNPVDFSFEIVTPNSSVSTIDLNEVVTGELSKSGETDIYQFTGTVGQRILFDGLASSADEIEVSLITPTGKSGFSSFPNRFDLNENSDTPLTLSEAGTYSLIVNSGNGSAGTVTGNYGFQILDVTNQLSTNTNTTGIFNTLNESQVFQFEGIQGQKLAITPTEGVFGTAEQLSNATAFLSTGQGLTEDGYLGIDRALNLPFRQGSAVNIILVTDEDRDIADESLNFETIFNGLDEQNSLLNVTINGTFLDGDGNTALGVDSDGIAYIADGTGGFTTASGGAFGEVGNNPDSTDPFNSTQADYVDLAWDIGGAGWDLNQLREGGDTAISFTEAFVSVKAQEIGEQLAIDLLFPNNNITVENLTGQVFGINPNETATFEVEITGDGLASSTEILFVRPDTNFVLGSIPVVINQNYIYLAQAIDPDGDSLTYSLVNAPDDATIDADTGRIAWNPPDVGTYDFEVAVSDDRGGETTQTFTVEVVTVGADNNAPEITSTAPNSARNSDRFTYQVTATDADNNSLLYLLDSAPEGVAIDSDTGLLTWTPTETQIGEQTIVIKVLDGNGGSDRQTFDVTVAENQAPVFNTNPVLIINAEELYQYDVDAIDPEGTDVTYSFGNSVPAGMTIDSDTGLIEWTPTSEQTGRFPVTIFAIDADNQRALQSFILNLGGDNGGGSGGGTGGSGGITPTGTGTGNLTQDSPIVNFGYSNTLVNPGEEISIQVQAIDDVAITSLQLLVDDNPVTLTPNSLNNGAINTATLQFSQPGVYEAVAIAEDGDGNTGSKTIELRVSDPNDTEAPEIELDTSFIDPLNPVITEKTDIIGSISDDNLQFYKLQIAPTSLIDLNNLGENDPDYITIAEGTNNIDGVIGTIDPNLFRNDTYFIRVLSFDVNGQGRVEGVILSIDSQTKPGEFSLDFTDLTVPIAGVPIEITRSYSSIDANIEGDFGYGWQIGLGDASIVESSPDGRDLSDANNIIFNTANTFSVGTRVTLNTPDGRRVGFTFDPVLSGTPFFFGTLYTPSFTADAGVFATLEAEDSLDSVIIKSDGTVGAPLFTFLGYNPTIYRLTTRDGTVYRYDQNEGLIDITDRNGNLITYNDDGIVSSTGAEIQFIRDAEGQITEIIDPEDKSLVYKYDTQGNLIGFVDREENETTFKYESDIPHYLTEVVDPLGRTGVRTEYENGQISKIFDADGNALDINYDSASSTQTINDPFGNTTTLVFDEKGNVITQIDAEGGRTERTYDDDNNVLTETDPEDNTTTYTYDDRGNILTVKDAEDNITTTTYNDNNDILTEKDAEDNITINRYDEFGNRREREDAQGNITEYDYDDRGLLTVITDAQDNEIIFTYDDFGFVRKLESPDGSEYTFTYDNLGNVTSVTNDLEQTFTFTYDDEGRQTSVTNPKNDTSFTEYNAAGDVIVEIDELERRTEFNYNDRALLIETIFPDNTPDDLTNNPRILNSYDALDRLITTTDELGRITYYEYDALGRLVETIYPDNTPEDLTDNPSMKMEYYSDGTIKAEIDELGNRTEFEYDKANNLILERDALGFETEFEYDKVGNQRAIIDANNHRTEFEYDRLGQLVKTIFANNTEERRFYNSLGYLIEIIDPEQMKTIDDERLSTEYEYDALGRLTKVINAIGGETEYILDTAGNIIEQIDANGNTVTFGYDNLNQVISTTLPLQKLENGLLVDNTATTTYDKVGNIKTITDYNGVVTTFNYDARDMLISRSYSDDTPTETFTYTLTGQLKTVTDNRGTTTYNYDERDRLLSRTEPDGRTISYTYDSAGNILTLITASGTTVYTYDALNRIDTVESADGGITDYDYDRVGNLIETTLPNGVVENRNYDNLDRLIYLENVNGNNVISSYDYTLDNVGNRTRIEEEDGRIIEYEYDALYRLTKETVTDPVNGNYTIEYGYDAVGNRLQKIDSLNGTTTYIYDDNDRLLSETTGDVVTQYQYDDAGNLTSVIVDGETTQTLEWNAKGELTAVEVIENGETGRTEFEYDQNGVRVAVTVDGEETRFLIDNNQQLFAQVIEEYLVNGEVNNSYTHGLDLISQDDGTDRVYYQVDGLGSTRNITDTNGDVLVEYTFDAYGNLISQVGDSENNYLFTGEQFDNEIGLQYNRARYYDASTGRFISRDPFEGFNDLPVSLHDYLYANVNPVNAIDPSGEVTTLEYAILATLIVGKQFAASQLCPTFTFGAATAIIDLALAIIFVHYKVATVLALAISGVTSSYLLGAGALCAGLRK